MSVTRRDPPARSRYRRKSAPSWDFVLPPELSSRFRVLRDLGFGAEAEVVAAEDVSTGRRVVIKLYHRGAAPDEEALVRLARAGHNHVVEAIDRGWAGRRWFEAL